MDKIYSDDNTSIYRFLMPIAESNMYIVLGNSDTAYIVDPHISYEAEHLLESYDVNKVIIFLTHEHYDHISGVERFSEIVNTEVVCTQKCADNMSDPIRNMSKYMEIIHPSLSKEDIMRMDVEYNYAGVKFNTFGAEIKIETDNHVFLLKAAPGHAQGGCLIVLDDKILFTGDNLVNNGFGVIYKWPGGSKKDYLEITGPLINSYDDKIVVMPGHGEKNNLGNLRKYISLYNSL